MLDRYRSVLRTPLVRRVALSGLAARLPIGMCTLAILLLLRAHTSSFAVPGVAVGAYAAANAVASPLQGRLVDRRGRTRVLATSTAIWAGALIALVLASRAAAPGWALITMSFAVGAAMPPFAPVVRALFGELIADPVGRDTAYGLDAVAAELVWISGPLIVGSCVAVASPTFAVLLTVAVGSAGAVTLLSAAPPSHGTGRAPEHWAGALAHRGLRRLLLPLALGSVGLGALDVGLPALAVRAGHPAAAGVVVAVWAFGSLIGGIAFAAWSLSGPLIPRYRLLMLTMAVCDAPLIAARSLASAIVLALVAGLAIAPFMTCLYGLVGRLALPGTETEAFTWTSTALVSGSAVGLAVGGTLSADVGISGPFVLAVAVGVLAALLSWASLPGDVDQATSMAAPTGGSGHPAPLR